MGQKVHPKIVRMGITQEWDSKWYAGRRDYARLLHEDLEVEKAIRKKFVEGVSKVEILRTQGKVIINIHSSKPGLLIGRGGQIIEDLKTELEKKFKKVFAINIKEIKKPALDSYTLAESIKMQIEKKVSYRRAAKMGIEKSMEAGAKGVKIRVSGRLNGVEISREEYFAKGKIPLHTFRADVDYTCLTAHTAYGAIGVKVWIYRGEVFKHQFDARLQTQIDEIKQA